MKHPLIDALAVHSAADHVKRLCILVDDPEAKGILLECAARLLTRSDQMLEEKIKPPSAHDNADQGPLTGSKQKA